MKIDQRREWSFFEERDRNEIEDLTIQNFLPRLENVMIEKGLLAPRLQQIKTDLERSQIWLQQVRKNLKFYNQSQVTQGLSHKSVQFYRNFRGFTGGHLKHWDYFNHVLHSPKHVPSICFSQDTLWNISNPWLDLKDSAMVTHQPLPHPDVLFVAGYEDWVAIDDQYKKNSPVPIINLIQHIRHADPDNPRYSFLKYKAIRICCSEQVATYLRNSGQVYGPIFTITCGLDFDAFPPIIPNSDKDYDILICALKEPDLGHQLKQLLERQNRKIYLLTESLLRLDYLQKLSHARVTIFLPNYKESEGFYLPALEGMALGTFVVCPNCIGNQIYCLHDYNCFRPEYKLENIVNSTELALQLSYEQVNLMLANAQKTTAKHSLVSERKAFWDILENVHDLWKQIV